MTRGLLLVCLLGGVAVAAPCPRRAALARVARAAFPPEVRTQGDGSILAIDRAYLHCTRVRAATQLGLLTFDTGDGLLVALLDGTIAVWQDGHVSADSLRNTIESAEPADLDGDGVDELLIVTRHDGHEQSGSTTLAVTESTDTDEDGPIASLALGDRNGTMPTDDGGWRCGSSWKLVRGPHHTKRIVTVGGCEGTTPDGFLTGRHVYALRGGQLVELHPR